MPSKSNHIVKPALKICHLADAHLGFRRYQRITKQGFNQREVDISLAFREAIDQIIEIQPDLVLVAGDLFHSVRPSNSVITFCFQQIRRLMQFSKTDLVMIAGNHDSPRRSDTGSILRLFKEIERVYVADSEVKSILVCNQAVQVHCLPHPALLKAEFKLPEISEQADYQILLAHAQVDERLTGEYGAVRLALDKLNPHSWDYIALGHVHSFIELSYNAAYSGALEHTSTNAWVDADRPKGFIEVTLPDRKLKFHALKSPRALVTLPDIYAAELAPAEVLEKINASIETVAGGISGKIVRLQILGLTRATLKNLDYQELRRIKAPALHFQIDFRLAQSEQLTDRTTTGRRTSLQAELKQYFNDTFSATSVPADQLEARLLNYLNKVEQSSEVAQS